MRLNDKEFNRAITDTFQLIGVGLICFMVGIFYYPEEDLFIVTTLVSLFFAYAHLGFIPAFKKLFMPRIKDFSRKILINRKRVVI